MRTTVWTEIDGEVAIGAAALADVDVVFGVFEAAWARQQATGGVGPAVLRVYPPAGETSFSLFALRAWEQLALAHAATEVCWRFTAHHATLFLSAPGLTPTDLPLPVEQLSSRVGEPTPAGLPVPAGVGPIPVVPSTVDDPFANPVTLEV